MSIFSKRGRAGADDTRTGSRTTGPLSTLATSASDGADAMDVDDDGRPLRPDSTPIGEPERQRIDAALARLGGDGVDVDDLSSLGAAYDAALDAGRDSDLAVETLGLGIGEHLARHGRMDWAVVTDVFGTDLGVVGRRRAVTVIPTNIVATRWLNHQSGWVPDVVGHLVRLGNG